VQGEHQLKNRKVRINLGDISDDGRTILK